MTNGLSSNTVSSIADGADGTMWFGTPMGLSALRNGKWRTYTMRDGLPSENVNSLLEDSKGVLWAGTTAGLASFQSGKGFGPRKVPDSLRESIFGFAEDGNGCLWVTTANHVVRVNRDKLLSDSLGDGDVREYGLADGLHSLEGVRRDRSVVADRLGRVWLSMNHGLSVVDPRRAAEGSAPAITHIEAVTADGSPIDLHGGAHVPAAHQRIAFSYAGLSLAIPERVRFRYKLDGLDRGWSEAVSAREAIYTNLGPGSYRFHVKASNSYGVWNGSEATLGVEIAPAFWEMWWFRVLCLLACAVVILALYRLRMHQLTREMNLRFEERLAERMHIAQELHDTLLQGFLSASMQLDIAADMVPAESPAKPRLERVLGLMRQVIEEGRNALRGLRSSERDSRDLGLAFARISEELAVPDHVGYRVIVNGTPRTLHPVIRDEVYRIGREALVNAFRHAQAKSIEVEVDYAASHLQLVVRDDGCGIDPHVVLMGREGHWGLPGMRERAEGISARLKVWSRAAGGTEVALSVPSAVAFASEGPTQALKWITRFYSRKNGNKQSKR
jgi:signal transduction histidine kinase